MYVLQEALLVLEEFGKVSSAVAFPIFECLVGPIKAVQRFGSEEMKQRLLPDITAGEFVVAVAMSEPDAGSAATDMITAASPNPAVEGGMILNGQKRWCSGAGHSDMVVFCKMDPEAKGARGIGAVYVKKDAPGVSFGPAETLMGFRGVPSADIYFEDVKIDPQDVLLPAGNFNKMMQAFCLERLGNATLALAK
jgi:butyryl-CoA dehydrogenase